MDTRVRSAIGLSVCVVTAVGCSSPGGSALKNGESGGTGNYTAYTGGLNGSGGGGNVPIIIDVESCGNGAPDEGETCDDSNVLAGDGCNAICQTEADWTCPPVGACTFNAACGDGLLASVEACDDANQVDGDGCSADCARVEEGWQCRVPGKKCVPFCGDNFIVPGAETCDVGDDLPGDGCSASCITEPGYSCETGVCIRAQCGNNVQETGESCDRGAANGLFYGNGTGCSKTCTMEPTCRDAAGNTVACTTRCGDGNIDPGEGCDDGNGNDGDGCSATCVAEVGFTCNPEVHSDTQPCSTGGGNCLTVPIIYRDFDSVAQAGGHPDFFFMSSARPCVPNASGIPDANWAGGTCANTDSTALCTGLVAPTLAADGKPVASANLSCSCRFTDWDQTGILNGVPGAATCNASGGGVRTRLQTTVQAITSAASFADWYHPSASSDEVASVLELADQGNGAYRFSNSGGRTVYDDMHDICLGAPGAGTLSAGFFPLDGTARTKVCNLWPYWVAGLTTNCCAGPGCPVASQWDPRASYSGCPTEGTGGPVPQAGTVAIVQGEYHNFYFTTEARYLFRYEGGAETLSFFGDDDVWVFVNGRLVLDLGATHERLQGTVTLNGDSATYAIQAVNNATGAAIAVPGGAGTVSGLGLEVGRTYEIAVFHADRNLRESNYQLTLFGFSTTQSACQPTCGDGVPALGEECDEGAANSNDLYGGCTLDCKYGPFCGDGVVNGTEVCDLGRDNGTPYGTTGCTAACTPAHYCGDGITDSQFGEECDLGPQNGQAYCDTQCKPIVT